MMTGKKLVMALLALAVLTAPGLVACGGPKPTATPTVTPAATPTATPFTLPASGSLGDTCTRPVDGMVMLYVPGGPFQMGSTEGFGDERPVHTVTMDSLWIDQTEVTNAQYRKCVEARVCQAPTTCHLWGEPTYGDVSKADHPAVCVDWYGAQAYCQWAGARLPTEAEWEYAARGPDGNTYPWGDTFDGTRLNFCDANCVYSGKATEYDDGYEMAAPVGSFENGASWCGALDMAGNVWEWVNDWYDNYSSAAQANPVGPDTGKHKVVRGGGWNNDQNAVRSANRDLYTPEVRHDLVGFRCVAAPGG
jgi:formylglycine-generating enzyme required for sulfatase activity